MKTWSGRIVSNSFLSQYNSFNCCSNKIRGFFSLNLDVIRISLWTVSFYVHLDPGTLCLKSLPFGFYKWLLNLKLIPSSQRQNDNGYSQNWAWCPWGSLPPRKFSLHMPFPLTFSRHKVFPLVPVFVDHTKQWEGVRNHTKIILSKGLEKHVDTYMIMNTTRNKTRSILKVNISIFNNLWKRKSDFFIIQSMIKYIFTRGNRRL